MTNKKISITEALRKVSETVHEYVDKNTPHIISKDVILTIPASSIVKADYETAKSNHEPYFVKITDTVAEEFNENNIYSVKFNEKEYECSYAYGSYTVSTDTMSIGITLDEGATPTSLDDEVSPQSTTLSPEPPYCYINLIDTTNITDIQLISKKVQRLDNLYLKRDLEVANSLTIGERIGNIGEYSLASGNNVEASGYYSHAEGSDTTASDGAAHAEGDGTKATNWGAHAEGCSSVSSGLYSHAENYFTKASSDYQHVQGKYNIEDTANKYAHIVGNGSDDDKRSNAHTLDWKGNAWFAGDVQANNVPHVISKDTVFTIPASSIVKADYETAIANGNQYYISITGAVPTINNDDLYLVRYNNIEYEAMDYIYASGLMVNDPNCSIALVFGGFDEMSTNESTVSDTDDRLITLPDPPYCAIDKLDINNITNIELISIKTQKLDNKFLESDLKIKNSISIGRKGDIGILSTAIGNEVEASGKFSHAEGMDTTASSNATHAEGSGTTASAYASHAEGNNTIASGQYSHASGYNTTASGESSYSEGFYTTASGDYSHAEGSRTKASSDYQHVQGKYNIEDTANKYAHIVGNGARDSSTNWKEVRSNAHTLDWEGNAWFAGKLSQEGTPTEDKDLTTKKYVDEHSANIADGFIMNDQVNGNKYLIQMRDGVLTSIQVPSSISVDSSSGGVTAIEGEAIDLNSIPFMANYPDGTSSKITDTENISYTPSTLTTKVTKVTFVYNIGGLKLTYDMPITVTTFDPAVDLQDFEYTTNGDGTYTLTGWKGTHNGVASTELIIPNSKKIIL